MQALLIIDIQKDYFPGGKMELVGADAALDNAVTVLQRFRKDGLPVIQVQHVSLREGAPFLVPDTEGVRIHERLDRREGEYLVVKNFPNSFHKTDLYSLIKDKGITELVVCGMMTHMCVDTTVRAAKDYDLPVTLISDACATRDLQFEGLSVPAAQVQAAYMAALAGTFATTIKAKAFASL